MVWYPYRFPYPAISPTVYVSHKPQFGGVDKSPFENNLLHAIDVVYVRVKDHLVPIDYFHTGLAVISFERVHRILCFLRTHQRILRQR